MSQVFIDEAATKAADVLQIGGIVLYPTDTLYGLGADAFSDEAVAKVIALKSRDEKKPIHCIVADMKMAGEYAHITSSAELLAAQLMPGPLTIILKKKAGIDSGIAREIDTIGIRIPKNDFCLEMVRRFGKPITTTSANIAGKNPAFDVEGIVGQLGGQGIDLIIDAGRQKESLPSTVVDLSALEPRILREGAISRSEILAAL